MIRINLLKGVAAPPGSVVGATGVSAPVDVNVQKQAGLRIAAVFAAIGLVYFYNMTVIQAEQARLAQIQSSTKKLIDETNGYGPTAPIVEKYNAEKSKTEKQLTVMKTLAGNRLREVKALDAIQSLIGGDTWLSSIHMKEGRLEMQGMSHSTQGVTELIRNLGQSVFFSNLQVKSATQEGSGTNPTNKFDLECQIGAIP